MSVLEYESGDDTGDTHGGVQSVCPEGVVSIGPVGDYKHPRIEVDSIGLLLSASVLTAGDVLTI
jgi:hypothetical protein